MRNKRQHMTLVNRLILFFGSFCIVLLFQSGMGNYQKEHVLEPLEMRNDNIQSISQFLNDLETTMRLLEDYRWDYGDGEALILSLKESQMKSAEHLAEVQSELGEVGENQYLLANAARITYDSFSETVDEIALCVQEGRIDEAAALYYEKAEPCGGYLRQYTQQLLERAILDSQSAYLKLNRLNGKIYTIRNVVNGVSFVLGTGVLMALLLLIHSVQELARAAQEISAGNLDVKDLDESMEGEIGHMAKAFNEMKTSMKRQVSLLSERNEMEREKMQLLRSQINPHFLFNTLNVVMYTARQENASKTASLIDSMSQLFRYALGSNEIEVPLAREVHIVKEFFRLQQVRFGERVDLKWDISPEVLLTETMVPSFVLQPLVENAFKHGIVPKEDGGIVTVSIFCQEQTLYIRVTDDGVGMNEKTLMALQDSLENPSIAGEHIGVCNVAARLRLRGDAGFELESKEGEGTIVEMYMPLKMLEEEETNDDKDIDC